MNNYFLKIYLYLVYILAEEIYKYNVFDNYNIITILLGKFNYIMEKLLPINQAVYSPQKIINHQD